MARTPAGAAAMPTPCRRDGRSPRAMAANSTVKSACVCTMTDARPGGNPLAMPKNWNRNCPVKSVRPIVTSAAQDTGGRGRNAMGSAAITNRSAVSCGGEKLSSATRVATNATPQMTVTSRASARSRQPRAAILLALAEVQGVALVVLDDELPRSPRCRMHVLHEPDPSLLEHRREGCDVVGAKVEVEMPAVVDELDRGVLRVHELQVEDLAARPDARVEILVPELEPEADL